MVATVVYEKDAHPFEDEAELVATGQSNDGGVWGPVRMARSVLGPGVWETPTPLEAPGIWQIVVEMRSPEAASAAFVATVETATPEFAATEAPIPEPTAHDPAPSKEASVTAAGESGGTGGGALIVGTALLGLAVVGLVAFLALRRIRYRR
ncbi:hypothetical protein ABZ477_04045 [Microbacterium sp. NPDC019599]|uniref:hypothetical protein n=1 Tax=Microbacterium sp. NPDC019599 TaxID=3154690 RepID=UPI0033F80893